MNRSLCCLLISSAALIAACTESETLTSPPNESLAVREAKAVASAPYAATDLGTMGQKESFAWAVNNQGSVVFEAREYPSSGGTIGHNYVRTGSTTHALASGGNIRGIGSGSTVYLVGYVEPNSVRWSYSTSTGFSAPQPLAAIDGYTAIARAINDLGDVSGTVGYGNGARAAIWNLDGSTVTIPNPGTTAWTSLAARDINNSGDVGVTYSGGNVNPDRAYVRTSDGVMIELLPLPNHRSTYVRGVSDRIGGFVYAGGTSDDDNGRFNAVRWKIDLVTHTVTEIVVAYEGTNGLAMANDGTLAGNKEGNNGSAFVWKVDGSVETLKLPKGLSNGRVWGISGDGRYVAGDGKSGSYHRGVLWSAQ